MEQSEPTDGESFPIFGRLIEWLGEISLPGTQATLTGAVADSSLRWLSNPADHATPIVPFIKSASIAERTSNSRLHDFARGRRRRIEGEFAQKAMVGRGGSGAPPSHAEEAGRIDAARS